MAGDKGVASRYLEDVFGITVGLQDAMSPTTSLAVVMALGKILEIREALKRGEDPDNPSVDLLDAVALIQNEARHRYGEGDV